MKELAKISEENYLLENQSLRDCSISDRDRVFKTRFPVLLQRIFPEKSLEAIDEKRFGDRSYITIFDFFRESFKME